MQIYLPIAEIPVNILVILLIGFATGFLAGMFGIGGGFLSTPLLMFIGISPAVAVSTSANQIIASSSSGLLAHLRKKNVDMKMGAFLVLGGFLGSSLGVSIFTFLQKTGHIDIVVALVYIIFLGMIGGLMLIDNLRSLIKEKYKLDFENRENTKFRNFLTKIDKLPWKIYFPKSDVSCSIITPLVLSLLVGILVALMGIGGGFLMIPAMIYILRMPSNVVVGTSLFQIIFIASNTTFLQAVTNNSVDIILSFLMIISSAIGAQFGTHNGYKANPYILRSFLALLILSICLKILVGLFITPHDLFILEVAK